MPYGVDADAFVDTFDGAGAVTNLESWAPSGGGAWTLGSGTAGGIKVKTNGFIYANDLSHYECTNQGSADHYIIFRYNLSGDVSNNAACVRLLGQDNWVGVMVDGSNKYLKKKISGVSTTLNSEAGLSLEWLKVEAFGTIIKWFKGGNAATPGAWTQIGSDYTVTNFSTETSQGLYSSSSIVTDWVDYFEAGALPQPLIINALSQSQTLDTSTFIQHNIVSGANLFQAQIISSPTVGPLITPSNLTQAQFLDGNAFLRKLVSGDNLLQAQSIAVATFTQHHIISPASLNQAHSIGTNVLKFFQFVFGNSKPSQIMRWRCYVDGVEVRLTSIQLRKYSDRGWNLNVVTPDVIAINLNAVCVVEADLYYADGSFYTETLAETFVTNTSITKGSTSLSVSITGSNVTPNIVNKTREVSNVTNVLTIDGKRYLRTPIDIDMNAGDHLLYDNGVLIVDRITYFISTNQASMEIIE